MTKKLSWKKHLGDFIETKNGYDLIECEECKIRHVIPIPDTKTLKEYYKKEFYDKQKPDYFETQNRDLEWWNMVYLERYDFFNKKILSNGKRVLDVGCGPGFFLKLGKELGWEILGIEPSSKSTEQAKQFGLEVINEEFNEKNTSQIGKFDVIHMQGVMEHLPNPLEIVKLCFKLLNPGGIFCTVVANDYNPFQNILKKYQNFDSWWFTPPEHINYFSISSINQICSSAGFEKVNLTTTFPIELFLLMGDNYVGNDSVGRECHKKRMKLEFLFKKSEMTDLKKEIYQKLSQLNLGRDIEAIFRKPLEEN